MNTINLIGRLTSDPKIKVSKTKEDKPFTIADYSLAVSRGKDKETDFIRVRAFGGCGDFVAKYLKKGMLIGISGKLQVSHYKDKDGNNHEFYFVYVHEHFFCEKRKEETTSSSTDADADDAFLPF